MSIGELCMSQRSILVVGSLNMDQVVRVPRIPVLGETLLGAGSLKLVPGGKGANQAVAMARLGASVAMAGRVGRDPFGEQLIESLRLNQVDTSLVVVDKEEASGVAFIFLAPDGNNAIVVASGANMRVGYDAIQMPAILAAIPKAQALVLQLEIPLQTVASLTSAAHKAGVPVVLNLAPAHALAQETLSQLHALIVNESEASLLTGQRVENLDDARIAATVLYKQGIANVIVTLGPQGALLATSAQTGAANILHQASPPVQVVDTTAAGDCFAAAFTVALCEGQAAEDALHFAVYASALKVTKFGAQSGLPTREEVEQFLHQSTY
jgi:ribokinase